MTVRDLITSNTDVMAYFEIHNMEGSTLSEGYHWSLIEPKVENKLKEDDIYLDYELDQWFMSNNTVIIMVDDDDDRTPSRNYFYPLSELGLSTRPYLALRRYGITTIQQLIYMYESDTSRIKKIRNIGETCFNEIVAKLQKYLDQEPKYETILNDSEKYLYNDLLHLIDQNFMLGVSEEIIGKLSALIESLVDTRRNQHDI